ncbi:TPA: YopX family protein [Streptococcus pyogenes]
MIPKFRAWDKLRKRISVVDRIYFDTEGVQLRDDGGLYWRCFRKVILMQSTGLKDKNGVEIFEGDVVARNDRFPSVVKFGRWVYEEDFGAKARNVGFYIDSSYTDEEWLQSIDYEDISKNYEVIGNIYENLELLEADNDPE